MGKAELRTTRPKPQRFPLIYADPPWDYKDKRKGRGGAAGHYKTARMAEIAMHIEQFPAPEGCVLMCWQTWPMETEQDDLLRGLGWRKVGLGFIWHKLTVHGKEHFGGGLAGTRGNTEPCFMWRRGRHYPRRVNASVREWVDAPFTEHSAKPPEVRRRIEILFGDIPRIELYARGSVPGWHVWGDQAKEQVA